MVSELLLSLTGCIKIAYPPTALTSNIGLQISKAKGEVTDVTINNKKNFSMSCQKHIHSAHAVLLTKQFSLFSQ